MLIQLEIGAQILSTGITIGVVYIVSVFGLSITSIVYEQYGRVTCACRSPRLLIANGTQFGYLLSVIAQLNWCSLWRALVMPLPFSSITIKESRLANLAGTARWNRIINVSRNRQSSGIVPEALRRTSPYRIPTGQMPKCEVPTDTPSGQYIHSSAKRAFCCITQLLKDEFFPKVAEGLPNMEIKWLRSRGDQVAA